MTKFTFYIVILFLFAACQNIERSEKPKDLIPEDKMVDVLTETILVNSARNYNKRLFENLGIEPGSYIYEKYEIDSLQLERSNNYYAENYTQYEDIYTRVKERLEGMKQELDSIKWEEEMRIEDSIREVEKRRIEDSIRKTQPELDSLSIDSLNFYFLRIERDSLRVNDSLIGPHPPDTTKNTAASQDFVL